MTNHNQRPGEPFDREQAVEDFNALCDEAFAAIDRVGVAAEVFRQETATQYGVNSEQVEVWIEGSEFTSVIRPPRPR